MAPPAGWSQLTAQNNRFAACFVFLLAGGFIEIFALCFHTPDMHRRWQRHIHLTEI
jgi:hypothetical protein